nr:tyrosine recombinase XerC [Uliginosibacterium gangwonense]
MNYLAFQRRLSQRTITHCRHALQQLDSVLNGRKMSDLQAAEVRRHLAKMLRQGLGSHTINKLLSTWRTFYRWQMRHGKLATNPVQDIHSRRVARTLPKVMPAKMVRALLNVPVEDALEIRDRAMFELLYAAGLRLQELCILDVTGLYSVSKGQVTVIGKGQKTRSIPVGEIAVEAIQVWKKLRAKLAAPDEKALFVNAAGTRISPSGVQYRLKAWAKKHGSPVHLHPHMFRHSFATHLLQSSGNLRAVQEMLGHVSVATTQIYTEVNPRHLTDVYDAAHPRARKSKEPVLHAVKRSVPYTSY